MSFESKDFWIEKDEHLNDGVRTFNDPSRIESKRSHQWIVDSTESDLFPNKKKSVQALNTNLMPGVSNSRVPLWENTSTFHPIQNQFIERLFGSDSRPVGFCKSNISPVGADSSSNRMEHIDEEFGNDPSLGLSISHSTEDPSYGRLRKVKVNQVKESNGLHSPKQLGCNGGTNSFISRGLGYSKDNVTLMGHTYNSCDGYIRSVGHHAFNKRDDITLPVDHTYTEDNSIISFDGFHDESSIPLAELGGNYDLLYHHPSGQMPEMPNEQQLGLTNVNLAVNLAQDGNSRSESIPKAKSEPKMSRKEAPNSFPSNVKSLLSTGMLDGVPVKYISLQRQEFCAIIKGCGYLCGCQSCNFSKVMNAYEFERHAGCKTKHPNNHIYFNNGKTIYQTVQELKSTPESKLFDTIQNGFGAPINQKSFRSWKESFQAATRELRRIYGKDELNL